MQNPVPFRPKTPRFAVGWTPAPWRDPSPLKVKEVRVDERRYVALREQLQRGDKSLVGNKGSDPISPPQLAFSMPDSGRRLLA